MKARAGFLYASACYSSFLGFSRIILSFAVLSKFFFFSQTVLPLRAVYWVPDDIQ